MSRIEVDTHVIEVLADHYGSNKLMTNKAILKMLDLHGITGYEEAGKVYGIEYYTSRNGRNYEEIVDLTGISRLNLLAWLGY